MKKWKHLSFLQTVMNISYSYTLNNDWIFSRAQGEKKPNPWRGMRVSLPPALSASISCSQFIIKAENNLVTADLHSFVCTFLNKQLFCIILYNYLHPFVRINLFYQNTSGLTYKTRSVKLKVCNRDDINISSYIQSQEVIDLKNLLDSTYIYNFFGI